MKKLFGYFILLFSLVLTGCASVPMADKTRSDELKQFNPPPKSMSGIYIYRDSYLGAALKKSLYLDGKVIGESAPKVFFYNVVAPGAHKISTESEFGNNDLTIYTEAGKNYFVRQYIKLGVFIGGSDLEQVSEIEGHNAIRGLSLAASSLNNQ